MSDNGDQFVLDEPVTAEQVRAAAQVLGFRIGVDGTDAEMDAALPQWWQGREVTLLLATLEALVVRCQLDQDLRDPTDNETRGLAAVSAQKEVGPSVEETLAAALRRVQAVAGLVGAAHDETGVGSPGHVVTHLLNTTGMLIAAWLSQCLTASRSGVPLPDGLDPSRITALIDGAGRTLEVAVGELGDWRQGSPGPG